MRLTTLGRLDVRVGQRCARLSYESMRRHYGRIHVPRHVEDQAFDQAEPLHFARTELVVEAFQQRIPNEPHLGGPRG